MLHDRGFWLSLVLLAAFWLLMSGGSPSSWVVGGPAVIAGAWAGHALGAFRGDMWSFTGVLRFLPFFLYESVRGGIDVTRRVMASVPRVDPGLHDYPLTLKDPHARLLFVNSVSLLPGTLAADLRDDILVVHAIDRKIALDSEIRELERAVGRIYGERS
jgi:multicomponent Na+:H+ antiporter subunit E